MQKQLEIGHNQMCSREQRHRGALGRWARGGGEIRDLTVRSRATFRFGGRDRRAEGEQWERSAKPFRRSDRRNSEQLNPGSRSSGTAGDWDVGRGGLGCWGRVRH